MGGTLKVPEGEPAAKVVERLKAIQGLLETASAIAEDKRKRSEVQAAFAEFLLDGLYAHRRINRNEELGYVAQQKKREASEPREDSCSRTGGQYN